MTGVGTVFYIKIEFQGKSCPPKFTSVPPLCPSGPPMVKLVAKRTPERRKILSGVLVLSPGSYPSSAGHLIFTT